ncbi:MAG: alginate export family protein [Methyloglobulus sp.]|nr:alginate export family protein [Methyloglobulus sp.]
MINRPHWGLTTPCFTGAYFNLADLGGPANFIHIHPTLDLFLTGKLKASFDWGFFWRENVNDALYSIGTLPIRSAKISQARYSGSSPAFVLTWEPVPHVTFLASYVHFFPALFSKPNRQVKK